MNQILEVNRKQREPKSSTAKDMLVFIIIFFIIFGLIICAYQLYQYISNLNINLPVEPKVPIITLTSTEENKLIMDIESEIGISNVTYNWNDSQPQTIETEGKNNVIKEIEIPIGENTINILVTDINGTVSKKEETFVVESTKPIISLSVVGNYIKITVTSEEELSEITYQWNSETVKKENMGTYANKKEFEKQLEIPVGQNTLKIVALDINGNKTEKNQEIKGVTKATTTFKVENGYLHFYVSGKENIKTVEFEFNGSKYLMNQDTFGVTKNVHYKVKLIDGMNNLKVISTTESGGTDTTSFEREYKLAQ